MSGLIVRVSWRHVDEAHLAEAQREEYRANSCGQEECLQFPDRPVKSFVPALSEESETRDYLTSGRHDILSLHAFLGREISFLGQSWRPRSRNESVHATYSSGGMKYIYMAGPLAAARSSGSPEA
jgi:hypothetical protein